LLSLHINASDVYSAVWISSDHFDTSKARGRRSGAKKGGKPTLKLAIRGEALRAWWLQILEKLTALPNCNSVELLQA
jgi:hypothetical protein